MRVSDFPDERKLSAETDRIREKAEQSAGTLGDEELMTEIEREAMSSEILRGSMTISEIARFVSAVFAEMRGLGILDPLLKDTGITEIMVNGPDAVFIEKNGKTEKTGLRFESEKRLEDIIQRVVGRGGREVNRANPIVDTRLPDGSRVNVVLPPVSLSGAVMTIRRFPDKPLTVPDLIALGSLTEEAAEFLSTLVRAKYNIFISGGTGSGKTTFLGALAGFIPPDERIITIEDSAELTLNGIENLVRLEVRNANSAGAGKVTVSDLIRSSLRMRPERIIVGEVRGEEAIDMLQAMNTGHDGSVSTGHANSPADMLGRLETMVLQGGSGLPLEAVRRQIASAIDIVVHLSRMRDGSRRTVEISEIGGLDPLSGEIEIERLFVFREEGFCDGRITGGLVKTGAGLKSREKLAAAGLSSEI
ncbi:MAG: CpaF family protein [Clostridiales bacterium]|nr:CpaF family protein [Clostridiales bacterium]